MGKTRASQEVHFGALEAKEAKSLIRLALAEDIPCQDVTTRALIPSRARIRGAFVPRKGGVVCGIPVAIELFSTLDPRIAVRPLAGDGACARSGRAFLEVSGPARPILEGERVALNFLQHLSGIATTTRRWRKLLCGSEALLLDTRKTIPGWRHLEKYAVRVGGGSNHRFSLSDQALVKDNHIRILRALCPGGPKEWVSAIRSRHPGILVELEVESLEEFREAAAAGADIILLDNMAPEEMERAARENRSRKKPRPLLEASGGINAKALRKVAGTGVDRISAGALTHSAAALDIAFDLQEVTCEKRGS